MHLDGEAQLILQSETASGGMDCAGFSGLPLVHPVFIAIAHSGSADALASAETLRQELEREIQALDPGVRSVQLSPGPNGGEFDPKPSWRKLLVLVGDEKHPIASRTSFETWRNADSMYVVLPIFPLAAKSNVTSLLPLDFHAINVEFWSRRVTDAIPAVLASAGLTPEAARIFISYRQKESAALAMQLFDALAHENFDVFLDHYRIDPGVNFQARLTQELGDKAMVLLIESAGILDSEWTTYEINVAKECGLGIFALHPPGGKAVPGVDEAIRRRLDPGEFSGGVFSAAAIFKPAALEEVVERVKREHGRALVRRRQLLRTSFDDALLLAGVTGHSFDEYGILHVVRPGAREYRVWLTPRPPELMDFHTTHLHCERDVRGVVIGLSRLMEPPRAQRTGWLANLCQIRLVDEGRLKDAAMAIAQGAW